MAVRLRNLHYTETQIEAKLAAINFEARLDKEKILQAANDAKEHEIWRKRQQDKRRQIEMERKAELVAKCNREYFRQMMEHYATVHSPYKKLIADEHTLELMDVIISFFTEDEEKMAAYGMAAGKGLMLRGISGLGKTFLLEAIKGNPRNPFSVINMLDVEDEIKDTGSFSVNPARTVVLDDVGTETTPVKFYGTDVHWFKTFVESASRYPERWKRIIITTNLNGEGMGEKYGARVRSRLRQMVNVYNVKGNDLRR